MLTSVCVAVVIISMIQWYSYTCTHMSLSHSNVPENQKSQACLQHLHLPEKTSTQLGLENYTIFVQTMEIFNE